MTETYERLAKVETEVKYLKEVNSKEHNDIILKLDRFIDSADKKYAPRWLMNVLSWVAGITAVIISGGIIKYLW